MQQNSSRSAAATEQQRREGEQLRLMVEELAPIQKQCDETEPTQTVPIRGTVLVWSVYEGRRLTGMEPVGLSATDLKAAMTVFLVRTKRRDRGFFLTNANDQYQTVLRLQAYRSDLDICAAYWPEKRLAGRTLLEGGEPPTDRLGDPIAERGTPPDLLGWVSQQPIETR